MSSHKIVRNVASNYATYALNIGITLVLTPLLLHGLGKRDFAVYVVVQVIYAILGSLDLGLLFGLIRFVSDAEARNQKSEISRLVSTVFYGLGALGCLISALVALFAEPVSGLLGLPPDMSTISTLALRVGCSCLGFDLAASVMVAYFQGRQQFHVPNVVEIVARSLRAVVIVFSLWAGYGLLFVVAAFPLVAVIRLAGNIAMSDVRPDLKLVRFDVLRGLHRFSLLTFVETNVTLTYLQADALLASRVLAFSDLAIIGAVRSVAMMLPQLVIQAVAVAFPMVVAAEARSETAALSRFLTVTTRNWLFLAGSCAIFLSIWASPLIATWLGPDFTSGTPILRILLIVGVASSSAHIGSTLLYGMGRAGFCSIVTLSTSALGIAAGYWGGRSFGATGLIGGLSIGHFAAVGMFYAAALHWSDIPVRKLLEQAIVTCLPSIATCSVVSYLAVVSLPHNWFGIAASATIVGLVSLAAFIMTLRPSLSDWRATVRALVTGS